MFSSFLPFHAFVFLFSQFGGQWMDGFPCQPSSLAPYLCTLLLFYWALPWMHSIGAHRIISWTVQRPDNHPIKKLRPCTGAVPRLGGKLFWYVYFWTNWLTGLNKLVPKYHVLGWNYYCNFVQSLQPTHITFETIQYALNLVFNTLCVIGYLYF